MILIFFFIYKLLVTKTHIPTTSELFSKFVLTHIAKSAEQNLGTVNGPLI